MKANELWIARLTAAVLIGGSLVNGNFTPAANAQVGVSVGVQINSPSDFYSPLAVHGSWVDVSAHGRCWRPAHVVAGWRPYEIGRWEWTDCGWYWVSDDPWAWACYHYGSWEFDPAYGWVWIPGTEWAPAWVVWRQAPDYIGWAPCGPGGGVAVADSAFMFVDVHHFHERLEPRLFVFNDSGILRRSHPVGGFRRETRDFDGSRRQIAFNQGPGLDPIQHATGTRFTARPVTELARQTPIPETVRRSLSQTERERPRVNQEQPAPVTGRERERLYREAPAAQPAPTGRQEQRIYREAPTPQPSHTPPQVPRRQPVPEVVTPPTVPQQVPHAPNQVPRRQPVPEASTPAVRRQQPAPPTGFERGRSEQQVPRREEPPPRAVPAPAQREPVAPPASRPERDRQKDQPGQ